MMLTVAKNCLLWACPIVLFTLALRMLKDVSIPDWKHCNRQQSCIRVRSFTNTNNYRSRPKPISTIAHRVLGSDFCFNLVYFIVFLPRCVECRRGLAMRILSVRLSVCLSVCPSNACIVTKRKKNLSKFLHHATDHLV